MKYYEVTKVKDVNTGNIHDLRTTKIVDSIIEMNTVIHQIERLSDGEIFTVGDVVDFCGRKTIKTMQYFEAGYSKIKIELSDSGGCLCMLDSLKKAPFTKQDLQHVKITKVYNTATKTITNLAECLTFTDVVLKYNLNLDFNVFAIHQVIVYDDIYTVGDKVLFSDVEDTIKEIRYNSDKYNCLVFEGTKLSTKPATSIGLSKIVEPEYVHPTEIKIGDYTYTLTLKQKAVDTFSEYQWDKAVKMYGIDGKTPISVSMEICDFYFPNNSIFEVNLENGESYRLQYIGDSRLAANNITRFFKVL